MHFLKAALTGLERIFINAAPRRGNGNRPAQTAAEGFMDQRAHISEKNGKSTETPARRNWEESEWFRRWLELIRAAQQPVPSTAGCPILVRDT